MSLFKKLGKALKSVVKVAAPIVGGAIGGPLGASIGGAVGSAISGSKGAKSAASTQSSAYDAAAQAQQNALIRAEAYQKPYQDFGAAGINSLTALNAGDYSGFNQSPDYLYALDQGLKGVEGSAAARGGLYSGNNLRALQATGSGLASQNLNNYRNALFQQVGVGQGAAGTLTGATLNSASNVGNALIGGADARASGIVGSSNAISNGINEAATAIGDYLGSKKNPVAGAGSTYGYKLKKRPNYNSLLGD